MRAVRVYQLFFLLKDFLYELFVVVAQIIHIASILVFKFILCLNPWIKLIYFNYLHWILGRPTLNPSIGSFTTKPLVMVLNFCGNLTDRFEAWLLEVIISRVTAAGKHLRCCLWSRCLWSFWRDQASGGLLWLITILVSEKTLRLREWRLLLLTAILDSYDFTT